MKIFGREINIFNKVEPVQNVSVNKPATSDIRNTIKVETTLYRVRQTIAEWRTALTSAESIEYPNRYLLYRTYKDIELDAHLTACVQQRKSSLLSKEWIVVDKDGKENEEKTKLIKSKWFYDFLDNSIDSKFYGHSLIQFGSVIEDAFSSIELVPRIYVKPEFDIVTENYAAYSGTNYTENPWRRWCIPVGGKRDLGLYAKVAPLVIWKKNAMGAWAEYQEIFGAPIRIGKTNVRDKATSSNMENMLKNMGVSAWGMFNTDDIIELIESNKTDAHEVFDKMIDRCNSEISKLILGQTGTTDEKAFVGSAKVHETVFKNISWQDEIFLENVCNLQLIPLMNGLNMGMNDVRIIAKQSDEFSLLEKSDLDVKLINTGKYKLTPQYIKEKYNTEVIEVSEPNTVKSINNSLESYYP